MKRLWFGIGLLAVFLVLGFLFSALFAALHQPLGQGVEEAAELSRQGDWARAREQLAKTRGAWERYRPFVAAVADHEPLEELEACLNQLQVYGQVENGEEFAALCARTAGLAYAMSDSQQLTWWNLL